MSNKTPEKLYVLVESFSDYDDSWQHNHVASFNKGQVEAFLINLKSERNEIDRIRQIILDARDEFMDKYVSATKEPDADEEWPRWRSGASASEITNSMRDERKAIQDRNAERGKVRMFILESRESKWNEVRDKLMTDMNLNPINADKYSRRISYATQERKTGFEIEEVDFLPSADYTPTKKVTTKVKP